MFSYFTFNQLFPFIISATIIVFSVIAFCLSHQKTALITLFIGSLCLGFFISNLDPFLMIWDEQYHALVAKNMMEHPFKPTLYNTPLFDYNYANWAGNNVWLHKQPLFLWQIAISLKLFGINELAVRIPSILLHALLSIMIYRIGKLCTHNDKIGYYGALFFTVAYYPLELVAGRYSTDHNDVAFLFYFIASFWAWFEYKQSNELYWLILIGVFSGCAVLVKWLTGLMIYLVWVVALGSESKKNWVNYKSYLPIIKSALIAFLMFLPWQIYTHVNFPLESDYELKLNSAHFFHAIENHSGNLWFHFNAINDIYGSGDLILLLIFFGLILLILKTSNKTYRIVILSALVITYTFFSIAATKMTSFCIIVSPFIFIGFGALTDYVFHMLITKLKLIRIELFLRPIVLIMLSFSLLNMSKIQSRHTNWTPNSNNYRAYEENEMKFIQKLKNILGHDKYVIFHSSNRPNAQIQLMFYTNYICYDFIPSIQNIEQLKKQQYKIAITNYKNLPDYISNDSEILKIK